jgi:hypothetical protein
VLKHQESELVFNTENTQRRWLFVICLRCQLCSAGCRRGGVSSENKKIYSRSALFSEEMIHLDDRLESYMVHLLMFASFYILPGVNE